MGAGATNDSLINNGWTADQLRPKLLGPIALRPDVPGRPLRRERAAGGRLQDDDQRVRALAPAGVDLTNTLVWSTGCHAGYNVVDADGINGVTQTLDWAQALAREGATLVAGTSFQYGDDELVEYSERIYAEFAHQLRVGTGAVAGRAVRSSSPSSPTSPPRPDIKGMHEKALLTAPLFGLPMFSVEHAGGTRDRPGAGGSRRQLDERRRSACTSADLAARHVGDHPCDRDRRQVPSATYFSGPDGVASNPGEPALPRFVENVGGRRQGPPRRRVPGRRLHRDDGVTPLDRRPGHGVRRRPDAVHLDHLLPGPDVDDRATSAISPAAPRTSS